MATAQIIELLAGVVAATGTSPVPQLTKPVSNRLSSQMPVEAQLLREAAASDNAIVTLYGADLALQWDEEDANQGDTHKGQEFQGDGSATQFQSVLPFVAWANYNWIVVQNGVVQEHTVDFTVTDVGGLARIDLVAAPADGVRFQVYFSAPETLIAATTAGDLFYSGGIKEINSRDTLWATVAGANVGPTNLSIRPLVH